MQNDTGNRHSPTVIAAAITSQTGKARLPTHISLSGHDVGLSRDSIVLLEPVSYTHLDVYKRQDSGCAIRSFADSYCRSGRLDAEYYQPKYEAIARSLNTSETVRSLCRLHDEPFLPKNHVKYPYIELADVGQSGDISGVDVQYGAELPTRARRVVKSGQIIVASVEGSMQSCALITDEYRCV